MTGKRIPSEIKQAVRIRAESESPEDFAMQLEIVERQLTAYRSIEKLTAACGNHAAFDQIVNRANEAYPDDFAQQLQAINSEIETMAEQKNNPSEPTGDRCFESDDWSDEDMQMLFYRIDGMGWGDG